MTQNMPAMHKMVTLSDILLVIFLILMPLPYVCSFETCDDFMSCELAVLSISLPNHCEMTVDGQVCLNNVLCSDISLGGLHSTYPSVIPQSFAAEMTDLNATCHGDWTLTDKASDATNTTGKFVGHVKHVVADAVLSISNNGIYPSAMLVRSCEVSSSEVTCTAHTSDNVIIPNPIVSGVIERVIQRSIKPIVCSNVISGFAENTTYFFEELLVPQLQQLGMAAPTAVPELPPETIDWGVIETTVVWDYLQSQHGHCLGVAFGWLITDILERVTNGSGSVRVPLELLNRNAAIQAMNRMLKAMFHLEVEFRAVSVSGLGSFVGGGWDTESAEASSFSQPVLSFVNAMSPASLDISLAFEQVVISVDVAIIAQDSRHKRPYKQPMEFVMTLDRFLVSTDLLLAVNSTAMTALYVDQLSKPSCLQSTFLFPFNMSDLNVSYSSMDMSMHALNDTSMIPRNSSENEGRGMGSLENDAVAVMNSVLELVYTDFSSVVAQTVFGIFEGPVRDKINGVIQEVATRWLTGNRTNSSSECTAHSVHTIENLAQWTSPDATVVQLVNSIVNQDIGTMGINKLMQCVTNGTGTLHMEVDLAASSAVSSSTDLSTAAGGEMGRDKAVVLTQGSLTSIFLAHSTEPVTGPTQSNTLVVDLAGLDSFFNFTLFAPSAQSGYELGNALGLGYCSTAEDHGSGNGNGTTSGNASSVGPMCSDPKYVPFSVTMTKTHFDLEGHPKSTMSLALTASNLALVIDLFAVMDRSRLENLLVGQLSTPGCVGSAFNAVSINNFALHRTNGTIVVKKNGEIMLQQVLESQQLVELLAQVGFVNFLNKQLESTLFNAESYCTTGEPVPTADSMGFGANGPEWEPESWEYYYYGAGAVVLLTLWVSMRPGNPLAVWITKWAAKGGSVATAGTTGTPTAVTKSAATGEAGVSKDASSDSLHSLESVGLQTEGTIGLRLSSLCDSDAMMYQSDLIPLSVRILIPIGCLFAAYLFIYSTIAVTAYTNSKILYDGETIYDYGDFFHFTLTITVRDMFFSGAEFLAVAVAFFSGAWPFIKLIITFSSWVLPTRVLSAGFREELLFWFDLWGKWAMSCTLVITVLAVGFNITLPIGANLSDVITSQLGWAYYSMLFGQGLSMILGHVVFSYHHRLQYCQLYPPEAGSGGGFHWPSELPPERDGFKGIPTGSDRRLLRHHVFATGRALSSKGQRALAVAEEHSVLDLGLGLGVGLGPGGSDLNRNTAAVSTVSGVRTGGGATGSVSSAAPGEKHLKEEPCFVAVTRGGQILGTVLIVASLVTAVLANWLICFDFKFLGATGYMMGDGNIRPYSIYSLLAALPEATGEPDLWEVICVKWFLIICCVAMPLIMVGGCFVLWLMPLTLKEMVCVSHIVEITSAWNILDIMLVCIMSTIFEIHRFAVYIVGSQTDSINEIIAQNADDTLNGDDVLIDIRSDMLPGMIAALVAVPLLFIVPTTLLRAVRVFVHDRLVVLGPNRDTDNINIHQEGRKLSYTTGGDPRSRFNSGITNPNTGGDISDISNEIVKDNESKTRIAGTEGVGEVDQHQGQGVVEAGGDAETHPLLTPLLPSSHIPIPLSSHVHGSVNLQQSQSYSPTQQQLPMAYSPRQHDVRQWSDDFEPSSPKTNGVGIGWGVGASSVGGAGTSFGGRSRLGSSASVGGYYGQEQQQQYKQYREQRKQQQQSLDTTSSVGDGGVDGDNGGAPMVATTGILPSVGILPQHDRLLSNWSIMKFYYFLFDLLVDFFIFVGVLEIVPLRQVKQMREKWMST